MFTQVLRNEPLRRGASLTFSEEWRDAKPGTYTVVARGPIFGLLATFMISLRENLLESLP